jgi:hypothetical protein
MDYNGFEPLAAGVLDLRSTAELIVLLTELKGSKIPEGFEPSSHEDKGLAIVRVYCSATVPVIKNYRGQKESNLLGSGRTRTSNL